MKNLILKNYFFVNNPQGGKVESFYEWLIKLKLHGKQSRARSRFVKMITERTREIDEERIKLAEQYSEKNKEGKVIYLTAKKDKDGKDVETTNKQEAASVKISDLIAFNKDYADYLNEDLTLDITPETQETIYGVRDILLNTEEEFEGVMAMRYDEICEAFEGIKKVDEAEKKAEGKK